jgi:hypothetical protein
MKNMETVHIEIVKKEISRLELFVKRFLFSLTKVVVRYAGA